MGKEEKNQQGENNDSEEDIFRRGFNEMYGYFLIWAGVYLSKGRGGVSWKAVLFVTFSVIMTCLFFVTIWKYSTDMELITECVHFVVFVTIANVAIISFTCYQRSFDQLFMIVGRKFYDYEGTLEEASIEELRDLEASMRRRKKLMVRSFITVVMIACFSITIVRPLMKLLAEDYLLGTDDDGLIRITPVTIWTPFDKKNMYPILGVNVMEYVISAIVPGLIFSSMTFLSVWEEIIFQYKILNVSLRRLVERAEGLQMERGKALRLCLRHSIRHHYVLIKTVAIIRKIWYFPLLAIVVGSMFLLCIAGFLFTSNDVPFVSKFIFFFFLQAEYIHVFIYCYYGESIQEVDSQVGDEIYGSRWMEYSKILNQDVLLIQLKSQFPLVITAGGFMPLNLPTYSNVISSAYSYFNILNAVR